MKGQLPISNTAKSVDSFTSVEKRNWELSTSFEDYKIAVLGMEVIKQGP